MCLLIYLFINTNQFFATIPWGITRIVEWKLKTLYCRCNETTLTSRINFIGSTDRRIFSRELSLWCGVLHGHFLNSTRTPFRWFQSYPTRIDGNFFRWSGSGGWSSCLLYYVVSRVWGGGGVENCYSREKHSTILVVLKSSMNYNAMISHQM